MLQLFASDQSANIVVIKYKNIVFYFTREVKNMYISFVASPRMKYKYFPLRSIKKRPYSTKNEYQLYLLSVATCCRQTSRINYTGFCNRLLQNNLVFFCSKGLSLSLSDKDRRRYFIMALPGHFINRSKKRPDRTIYYCDFSIV